MPLVIATILLLGQATTPTALPAQVTKSLKLTPREYRLTAPLVVSGSNLVLDGAGATLRGNGSGIGLRIAAGQKVTVKNLKVVGFRWGIQAEDARDLTLINVTSNGNQNHFEAMEGKPVADMEGGKEPDYGGGILLRNVAGGLLQGVEAHAQWNGLTLSGCSKVVVEKSDFSKNDDTGIHLWKSSDNEIRDSRVTWVGVGIVKSGQFAHKGGDQAGILLEHDSNRNKVLRNNLVHCVGDGAFIRANELAAVPAAEARKQGAATVGEQPVLLPTHPSNDNLFQGNDASFAEDANAFESDFCSGNRFVENVAAFSNYGFWLEFSRNTVVKGNTIVGNKIAGVQLDNGWTNVFEGNTFVRDLGSGVAMAFSDEEANASHPNHGAQNRSGDLRIFGNVFSGYSRPFRLVQTSPATIQANTFVGLGTADLNALAEVQGPKPLFVLNETEAHVGPDLMPSQGEFAPSPGLLDRFGGVRLSRLAPKATEAVIEGSLTGRFDGEQFEIARIVGPAPANLVFPPRVARVLRVRGAEATTASFVAQFGDRSFGRRQSVQASSDEDAAEAVNDGDWLSATPWRPSAEAGQTWAVDLGGSREVTSFLVLTDTPETFWPKFHLEISPSGLFNGEQVTVYRELTWEPKLGGLRVIRIPAIKGRYARLVADAPHGGVTLQELSVYGSERD